MTHFNIFGSKSSIDWDIMVAVDKIPSTTKECQVLVEKYNVGLEVYLDRLGYKNKPINCNICVVENFQVVDCFKGCVYECNNAVYSTYKNFQQQYPPLVIKSLYADTTLKILRSFRVILSYLSRTPNRDIVKKALNGNLAQKINCLNKFDFSRPLDLGDRNVIPQNFYKMLAFQLGQTLSLLNGREYYTKEGVDDEFECNLHNPLMRHPMSVDDYEFLEKMKNMVITRVAKDYRNIMGLNEELYNG